MTQHLKGGPISIVTGRNLKKQLTAEGKKAKKKKPPQPAPPSPVGVFGTSDRPLNYVENHSIIWGAAYQTDSDPVKMRRFVNTVTSLRKSVDPDIVNEIHRTILQVFYDPIKGGDEGTDINSLSNIMVNIAIHESLGFKKLKQDLEIKGDEKGVARGIMQVEPKTAFSLLKNSSIIGKKARDLLTERGMDLSKKISTSKMNNHLMDNVINTIFGTAQLLSGAKQFTGLLGAIS
jgi:hypothetical protein